MRRAVKDRGWDELQRIHDEEEIIDVMPYDANRGGLLVELEGIRGSCRFPNWQPLTIQEYQAPIKMRSFRNCTP